MTTSLIEFVHELLSSSDLRTWFAQDPHAALDEYGLGHLTTADVNDALVLVEDTQTADFSRSYDFGGKHSSSSDEHHDGGGHGKGDVQYKDSYVTHDYVSEVRTVIDQSTNQTIDTHGKNFYQDLDNHSVNAIGNGAVATGGDIDGSSVVTGSHNTVGDGNVSGDHNVVGSGNHAVTGDNDTTAFGNGSANSVDVDGPVKVGDGAAFNSGSGTTALDNSDNSKHDVDNNSSDYSQDHVGNHWTDASQHGSNNNSSDHSDNSDHSQDHVGNDLSDHSDHSDHSVVDSFLNHHI